MHYTLNFLQKYEIKLNFGTMFAENVQKMKSKNIKQHAKR